MAAATIQERPLLARVRQPSAENLITLGRKHHDGTTCHVNLWQKVSVSVKTESP